jgi:hypothetical protein
MAKRKTIAELEEEESELHKRIERLKQAQKKKDRDWRNHGLIVIGSFVEKYWFDGDWTTADIRKFMEYVQKYKNTKALKSCKKESCSAEEANIEIRKFERELREKKTKTEIEDEARSSREQNFEKEEQWNQTKSETF